MKSKHMIIPVLVCALTIGVVMVKSAEVENKKLEAQIERLREERERKDNNKWLICNIPEDEHGLVGEVLYLDCGESFVPRYATCFCTLMCLDDYSATINNLSPENCPHNPEKEKLL